MDYSNPKKSGKEAFINGIPRTGNPIDRITHANHSLMWFDGWDLQNSITCKGRNCTAASGVGHSSECENDHDELYSQLID